MMTLVNALLVMIVLVNALLVLVNALMVMMVLVNAMMVFDSSQCNAGVYGSGYCISGDDTFCSG